MEGQFSENRVCHLRLNQTSIGYHIISWSKSMMLESPSFSYWENKDAVLGPRHKGYTTAFSITFLHLFSPSIINCGIWQDQRTHSSNPLDVVTQKPQAPGENCNETIWVALGQILLRSKKSRSGHHWITVGMLSHISVDKAQVTDKQSIIVLQN